MSEEILQRISDVEGHQKNLEQLLIQNENRRRNLFIIFLLTIVFTLSFIIFSIPTETRAGIVIDQKIVKPKLSNIPLQNCTHRWRVEPREGKLIYVGCIPNKK